MPQQDLYYPYKTDYDPGPIYGGWLAGQREGEAKLLRLQQLYQNQQELQKSGIANKQSLQMNPLLLEQQGIVNQGKQQEIDIKSPEQQTNRQLGTDPDFIRSAIGLKKGQQKAELDEQEIIKRAGQYDELIQTFEDSNGSPMAVISQAEKLGIPKEKILPHFKQEDPLASLKNRKNALLDQVGVTPKVRGTMAVEAEKGKWDISKAELDALTRLEVARIMADSRVDAAGMRGSGGTSRPMTSDQKFASLVDSALARGEITEADAREMIAQRFAAGKQQGLTLEGTPQGLQRQSEVPILKVPNKQQNPASAGKGKVWNKQTKKWE